MVRSALCAAVLAVAVSGLSGCMSTPRVVATKPGIGGVVAVPSDSNSWPNYNKDEAMKKIQKECNGQPYEIVLQRQYDPHQDQRANMTNDAKNFGPDLAVMMNTAGTEAEYRYVYRIKPPQFNGPGAPPPLVRGPNGQLVPQPFPVGGNMQPINGPVSPTSGYGATPGRPDMLLGPVNPPLTPINPTQPIGQPSGSPSFGGR